LQEERVRTRAGSTVAAVVVVEAVRAALLGPEVPREHEPASPQLPEVEGSDARLWLFLGPRAAFPTGGMGPSAHGAFGIAVEPDLGLRLAASAWLPLTTARWTERDVAAETQATLVLGRAGYQLLRGDDGVIDAGLGAGLLSLSVEGQVGNGLLTTSDRLVTGVYFVHAGAAWNVASWMRLRGGALWGLSTPRPVVTIDGSPSAAWGRMFVAAALSAELGLSLSSGAP
jgi:hypothetical protein